MVGKHISAEYFTIRTKKLHLLTLFSEKVTGSINWSLKQLVINIFSMDLPVNYVNVAALVFLVC